MKGMRENTDLGSPTWTPREGEQGEHQQERGQENLPSSSEQNMEHAGSTKHSFQGCWEGGEKPAEWKFSEEKKTNPMCKDLLLYTGFWPFSLTDLKTNTTNSQPFPWGFVFFFLPSFVFLKTVSPAGVGNSKPFSCVLWACLLIYGFTTSPGLSWNWKPWVQHWEMKSDSKFIHFPQSNYFSPPFTCSSIHSYINLFWPQILL